MKTLKITIEDAKFIKNTGKKSVKNVSSNYDRVIWTLSVFYRIKDVKIDSHFGVSGKINGKIVFFDLKISETAKTILGF